MFDINKAGVVSLMKNVSLDRETTDRYTFQVSSTSHSSWCDLWCCCSALPPGGLYQNCNLHSSFSSNPDCVPNQVVAVDQVSDGLRATAQINITILDSNDHSPQFPAIPDPLLILEGDYSEGSPGVVHTILPTDEDLGSNGEVTVSLSSPHPLFRFREVSSVWTCGSAQLIRRPSEVTCCVPGWSPAGRRPPGQRAAGSLRAGRHGLGRRKSPQRGETVDRRHRLPKQGLHGSI